MVGRSELATLEDYLESSLDLAVSETRVVADGLNLVISVTTEGGDITHVVRSPRRLRETVYMLDLEREYRLLEQLASTAIPVPAPVAYCGDTSIIGEAFYVSRYLKGETVPFGRSLPERFRTTRARREFAEVVIDTLARIHRLDPTDVSDVCDYRTTTARVMDALDRLTAAQPRVTFPLEELKQVGAYLEEYAPDAITRCLVHGDYRPDNVVFGPEATPRVAGVIDWETASLGDPRIEVGYLLLRWREEDDRPLDLSDLEARYSDRQIRRIKRYNTRGIAPYTAKSGSPSRGALIERYSERTSLAVENLRYFTALGAFLLATVWVDLHRDRIEAGEQSDWAPYVEFMAKEARAIIENDRFQDLTGHF